MRSYQALQSDIGRLSSDYDRDERELEEELRQLEERNKHSMRAYKRVHEQASEVAQSLQRLAEAFVQQQN